LKDKYYCSHGYEEGADETCLNWTDGPDDVCLWRFVESCVNNEEYQTLEDTTNLNRGTPHTTNDEI